MTDIGDQPLVCGRIVHYQPQEGLEDETRDAKAAIVAGFDPEPNGIVDLVIFDVNTRGGSYVEHSVEYSEAAVPGTWHWPPRSGD